MVVTLLAGCGHDDVRPAANLVIVAVDTLRADHLGCYGYARPTSPRIDAFAKDGVLFETAVSAAPWTLPAFASIFTGLLPSHHRAGEGKVPYVTSLDGEPPTLAGVLREHGFATASFVSNVWVGKEVGLDRGFETFALEQRPSAAVDRATQWLATRTAGRFFLFVHIFDPHAPYTPVAEDARLFVAPEYAGPFAHAFPAVWIAGHPDMRVDPHWSAADRRQIVDLYDAEIHYADSLVGRVLDALVPRSEDTLVVFVADHGEELFDHEGLDHGRTLYDELLRVPFVLRFPGGRPRAHVAAQVQTMDLMPTVLDALGVPVPANLDGESLMPVVRGERRGPMAEIAVSESAVFAADPDMRSARLPGEKAIVAPGSRRAWYFDLSADPGEHHDLAATRADRVQALGAALDERVRPPVEGFYLQVVGERDGVLHVGFETPAGFTDVELLHAESDDRATLAPDGHALDVDFSIRPRQSAASRYDLDGVRFRTRDGEPAIVVAATLDGGPLPSNVLATGFGGRGQTLAPGKRWSADRLLVRRPTLPTRGDGPLSITLQLVRATTPAPASFDADAVERLRALGYVR